MGQNVHLIPCLWGKNASWYGMADLFDYMEEQNSPPPVTPPVAPQPTVQVDPRLLERALKKVQSLIKGNGLKTTDVILSPAAEDMGVRIYHFKARTFLKLVPEYGIKTEAGRNTKAELMKDQAEFNHALGKIVADARTQPEKRKQIVDFMFGRSDKGFGIKEQRIKFHMLARDFVQHEKCQGCKNTGKTVCAKCQGHGVTPCINCQGRRQVVCPRCRGTAKIHAGNKIIPCDFCRADGKINCPKCAGRGQNKCQNCAANGLLQCQPCAGTGWVSNLAHIDLFAQIFFDFDRTGLPATLVSHIEKSAAKLVEKNDIEVSLKEGWTTTHSAPSQQGAAATTAQKRPEADEEPDDSIWLDYNVTLPYGPLSFMLKEKKISANLFGYQARLFDSPAFLDELTRIGQQALLEAAAGRSDAIEMLRRAARYSLLKDVLSQTLRLKNPQKAMNFLASKYTTGIKAEKFDELTTAADIALRRVSRKWRIIGLAAGSAAFALIAAWYYPLDGRASLLASGTAEAILTMIDIALIPFGMGLGVICGKILAKKFQEKSLTGVINEDILKSQTPRAGKIIWWSLLASTLTICVSLGFTFMLDKQLPVWADHITKLITH